MVIPEGWTADDILMIDVDDFQNSLDIAFTYGLIEEEMDVETTYDSSVWEEATGN